MWSKPEQSKSSDFIRLEDGANRVRIVSEPVEKWRHFVQGEDGKKRVAECTGQGCTFCHFDKAKKEYCFAAISRNEQLKGGTASVKLLTVGQSVYSALWDLMNSEDWRFDGIPGYDIVITKKGQGLETEYSVQPVPAKPLSEADAEVVRNAKRVDELVRERFGPKPQPQPEPATDVSSIPF